tara:strand:- start:29483 stop:31873 length:2391 start_codon:yes stop_codon:yes gene_type:complete
MLRKLFLILILTLPLTFATSHYSFEHAESLKPLINWNDYAPEAFEEAIEQNKPIFLLLTAPSWCYWCQVYESEEYLFHPNVISIINSNFIPIYVDADQRQDLTRQYLEGGWPSTTVLTPDRKRIYGYSGPRPVQNMLENLRVSVNYVKNYAGSNSVQHQYVESPLILPDSSNLQNVINSYAANLLRSYDPINGGFGGGQKFPRGRSLDFSLDMYEATENQQFLTIVETTLQNQYTNINELETNYNLFDPVEGGFHRYGTKPDWTPPHYEKMLYDNARLLKAYTHLNKIKSTPLVQEVVKKTDLYITNNWYDPAGGFYGNTDVHGEHHYYALNPRPSDKPRVEKTKYTDWNSEAIITYLEINPMMAKKSLDYLATTINDNGAHHYDNQVQGNLLDNSNALLAFTLGHELLNVSAYLTKAKQLADYSINNLYDWKSGGFFERNSIDQDLYAPGENIVLTKPTEENGIIIYALLKLYQQTQDQKYLYAALNSFGYFIDQIPGLDRGYYFIKSAQLILENNWLATPLTINPPKEFWLNKIIASDVGQIFKVSDKGIETMQGSVILLFIISLLAGLLSFASPCTLPILPAYIAYTIKSPTKNLAIPFFIGLSSTFTVLGMTATYLGSLLKQNLALFSQIAGVIIIVFGFYILSGKGFSGLTKRQRKPNSYLAAFFFGATMGISWTPCVGPILISILLLASTTNVGGILLFAYSIGLALPLLFLSKYLSKNAKFYYLLKGKQINIFSYSINSTTLFSALLFIILGYLIYSGTLFTFNQYFTNTGIQNFLFKIEEWLLNLVNS